MPAKRILCWRPYGVHIKGDYICNEADYIVKNGFIEDNRVLIDDPFRTVGGIIDLFENHVEERNKLIMTINDIKRNALEIS